jgi:hypothetical protein
LAKGLEVEINPQGTLSKRAAEEFRLLAVSSGQPVQLLIAAVFFAGKIG